MNFGGDDQPTQKIVRLLQRVFFCLCALSLSWHFSVAQTVSEKLSEARNKPATKAKTQAAPKTVKPTAAVTAPNNPKPVASHPEPTPAATEAAVPAAENNASAATSKDDKLPFKLNDRKETPVPPPSPFGIIMRTIGALLLIVGLVFGAAWVMKRFDLLPFNTAKDEANGLKIISTVRLGERRALSVVKFGEKTLLIGCSQEGITLLSEQDDEIPVPVPQSGNARTVTDLLARGTEQNFEREFARATTPNTAWSGRRN